MIPLKINDTHLCTIFDGTSVGNMTDAEIQEYCIDRCMFPTAVNLISETYSRDAERTADYELEYLKLVNRKAKPAFTWNLIKATYVQRLMEFLKYDYNFKDSQGVVIPREAENISVTYLDFVGMRTINAYLGQTLEGVLVEYDGVQYWENFTISFPER